MWYVVDGADGSGKSTVADMMAAELEAKGRKVLVLTHPSQDHWAGRKAAKYLLSDSKASLVLSTTFYILDVLHSLRLKKKNNFDDIIFVRYILAVAYLPRSLVKKAYDAIAPVLGMPEVAIFVDTDPKIAMDRILERGEDLEIFETVERLQHTRNKMILLIDDWVVIDNNNDCEQTLMQVRERIPL